MDLEGRRRESRAVHSAVREGALTGSWIGSAGASFPLSAIGWSRF
jgi:hypothetical protein